MFSTIILKKYVDEPPKPKDLADAMQMVGNNIGKLPNLIWKGLKDEARDAAYANMEGFRIENEDKDYEEWEIYTGKFADENKSKLINAAVLTVAKLQGYNKSMSPDEKRKAKETAREFLRSNPAMLKGIQD